MGDVKDQKSVLSITNLNNRSVVHVSEAKSKGYLFPALVFLGGLVNATVLRLKAI